MPKLTEDQLNFDTLPDPTDFRDKLYEPTLVEVGVRLELEEYLARKVPVLRQGSEGSCTGHGLATVANYLLRRRAVVPDDTPVSPRMLYEMAKRYDEWEGEDYQGSSARGAMKGWHKHGVCSAERWPYESGGADRELTTERAGSAIKRPLGAYYRVNPKDLVAMHCALAEVEILFATAVVHAGWLVPDADAVIGEHPRKMGGHAFAIVAYDADGFWVQNSWGERWGRGGLALLPYDDWLEHAMDVWVARLGVPIHLKSAPSAAVAVSETGTRSAASTFHDLRPHIVSVGNDGGLRAGGTFGTTRDDVRRLFQQQFVEASASWKHKRLLIYAHGGLVGERAAVQRVAEYRAALLDAQVYPVAFVWKTDFWTTLKNILQEAIRRRRPEGPIEKAKDYLLDRLDDAIEPLARRLGGKAQWDEMKENARLASSAEERACRVVAAELAALAESEPELEIHFAGHSAGSILLAPLVRLLTAGDKIDDGPLKGRAGYGLKVATCTLWAPACTVELFRQTYLPAIDSGALDRFAVYNLTDHVERDDDCAGIYHKSLLYLVSHALEDQPRVPEFRDGAFARQGTPLLGLERSIRDDRELARLFDPRRGRAELVLAPNQYGEMEPGRGRDGRQLLRASRARHHGDFDDDLPTVRSTLARIVGLAELRKMRPDIEFRSSAQRMSDRRRQLTE